MSTSDPLTRPVTPQTVAAGGASERGAAGEGAGALRDHAESDVRSLRQAADSYLESGKNRIADEFERAGRVLGETAERLTEEEVPGIGRFMEDIARRSREAGEALRGRSPDELASEAVTMTRDNPLPVLGAAFLVGLGLGRLVASSGSGGGGGMSRAANDDDRERGFGGGFERSGSPGSAASYTGSATGSAGSAFGERRAGDVGSSRGPTAVDPAGASGGAMPSVGNPTNPLGGASATVNPTPATQAVDTTRGGGAERDRDRERDEDRKRRPEGGSS